MDKRGIRKRKEKLIPLTRAQLTKMRKDQYNKQNGICPILKQKINFDVSVFDHKHKLKSQECGGENGLGCLRGVIHREANSFLGKIERLIKRYGLQKVIHLPELLRNCADYVESPPMSPVYIHPTERPKRQRLSLHDYKRICKYYFVVHPKAKKLPKYPKDSIMTKKWIDMIDNANKTLLMDKNKELSKADKQNIGRAKEMMKKENK